MSQLYPQRDSLAATEFTAGNQSPRLDLKAHRTPPRPAERGAERDDTDEREATLHAAALVRSPCLADS